MAFKIPGLSFSWKRALGITKVKQRIARATGIPTTRQGRHAKLGRSLLGILGTAGTVVFGIFSAKKIASKFHSKERSEYIALRNIRDGKPADFSDISNPDYVTRPTYSTDMTSYTEYIPRLTPLGEEALKNYENK